MNQSLPRRAPGRFNLPAPSHEARENAVHDAELVRRFKEGENDAFVEIVNRHYVRITKVALALIGNRSDAEEIAQDTFVRAHRGLGAFRGDSSLATWLHHIATNLARNRYWYFIRRRRHVTISLQQAASVGADVPWSDLVASDAMTPASTTTLSDLATRIGACMEKLSEREREILTLRAVLHRPYGEIARTLSLKIGTVKSRIARARNSLRAQLEQVSGDNVFAKPAESDTALVTPKGSPARPA